MTALRDTPPSSSAIWLAVEPPSHMRVSLSMRSSVQLMRALLPFVLILSRTPMWGV
jgi:hypothetical protein